MEQPMNPHVEVTQTTVEFPHQPISFTCPTCHVTGVTRVEKKLGAQFFICLIICILTFWTLIGLILLCCLCCNDNNFDFNHYCSACGAALGSRAVITTKKVVP